MPLAQVLGHRPVLRLLARAVARDSLPPSLIFAGPAGVGKFTTAIALTQLLNCTSPRPGEDAADLETDACGQCRLCRWIRAAADRVAVGEPAGTDCFVVLQPDDRGSIKIDPVRGVIEQTVYRPFDGRRRLAVIDEADALEVSAQNALLKVLEEPPSATAFVLVTARPDALLPTIRSRCCRLRFGLLGTAEVASALVERFGVPPEVAAAAAMFGAGSLGRALAYTRGRATETRSVALRTLEQAMAGRSPGRRLAAAQTLVGRVEGDPDHRKGSGEGVSRAVLADRLVALEGLLRDVHVLLSRADERLVASRDLSATLAELARRVDHERLDRAFAAVHRARAALERNASPKVVADWVALQL